jgi:hypothetical protein
VLINSRPQRTQTHPRVLRPRPSWPFHQLVQIDPANVTNIAPRLALSQFEMIRDMIIRQLLTTS